MTTLETIVSAINQLKQISFTYQNDQTRIGNPYAVYILPSNNTTKVHVVQTSGYTSSGKLNQFKQMNIEDIKDIQILDGASFLVDHEDYKPESQFYSNVIAKV